jgi:hypothetical protein
LTALFLRLVLGSACGTDDLMGDTGADAKLADDGPVLGH